MPRLIFKCPHVKGGTQKAAAHLKNLVRYVATREGAERVAHRENYLGYIAQRLGSHGLFTADGGAPVLSRAMEEVANHPGTVWLPIISLRREDAARLGYDSAGHWRSLLAAQAPELAKAMKIPPEQFRWYAAFHDKEDHPHIHMVCWSADGRSGFLTERGIEQAKSTLAREIFRQDLTEIYQRQTQRWDELTQETGDAMRRLAAEMRTGRLENRYLEQLIEELARRLRRCSGKKQYGYLSPAVKSLVDEIVDELAKDPRVAAAYELWYEQREEVLRTYRDNLPKRLPLSQQKEFKRIKNIIIGEAAKLIEAEPEPQAQQAEGSSTREFPPPVRRRPEALARSVTGLLRHLGKLFEEQRPRRSTGLTVGVDSKLRRKIREKKIAMGHRADDHEEQTMG